MNSPWQNPLPTEKYITQQVVVYFYAGRWVPITFYAFTAAIELYHRAKTAGQELYIFPTNTLPNEFEQLHQLSHKTSINHHESRHFKASKLVAAS